MAKVTRDVKQYEVYTLYALVRVLVGKRGKEEITRTDRVPVAIFDDRDLLNTYVEQNANKLAGQTGYEDTAEWREMEPGADQFSLPFNPAPEEPREENAEQNNQ